MTLRGSESKFDSWLELWRRRLFFSMTLGDYFFSYDNNRCGSVRVV